METGHELSATDELAILRLSSDFGYFVDRGRATECATLFTPTAKLIFNPNSAKPVALEGIEAISGFLANREGMRHVTTRHLATNFRLTAMGGDEVHGHSLLTVYRSEDEGREPRISAVCDIAEVFRKHADGVWKISERITDVIFAPKA